VTGNHPRGVIAAHPSEWDLLAIAFPLLLAAGTADKASTFLWLFVAQALAWAGVPAVGAAAAGAAGALASQGTLHLWAVLVVGTAGAEVGSIVGWWMGRHIARAGLDREGRLIERRKKALDAGEKIAHKWGRLIVFFVPSWVSGAMGMSLRQFAIWNLLAAFLWNIGAALAAYGIASAASNKPAPDILIPLLIGIALLGTIFLVLRTFWRHHIHGEQAPVAPGV
jgi:membrane protein DedA with SNARE-associated domain